MEIIPVINKVDLPGADISLIQQQLEDVLAIPAEEAVLTSGKTGIGVRSLMKRPSPVCPSRDGRMSMDCVS